MNLSSRPSTGSVLIVKDTTDPAIFTMISSRPDPDQHTVEIVKDGTIDPAQFVVSSNGRTLLIKNADENISLYDLFAILHGIGVPINYKEQ